MIYCGKSQRKKKVEKRTTTELHGSQWDVMGIWVYIWLRTFPLVQSELKKKTTTFKLIQGKTQDKAYWLDITGMTQTSRSCPG